MEELLGVTICDPLDFNEHIFRSWLRGLTSTEAAEEQVAAVQQLWTRDMDHEASSVFGLAQQKSSGLFELLEQEVVDHYRSYEFLEHFICQPLMLTNQVMIRIPDNTIQWIICQYYTLDDLVARALLGKRLFKNRKELEDISESSHIHLTSVTRQFENLQRVYQSLEETQFQVNFMGFIESTFVLPSQISRKYACLLFLVAGRFDVSSKKRLQRLTCTELENCSSVVMACLLPDIKTFLGLMSGPFDSENVDIPHFGSETSKGRTKQDLTCSRLQKPSHSASQIESSDTKASSIQVLGALDEEFEVMPNKVEGGSEMNENTLNIRKQNTSGNGVSNLPSVGRSRSAPTESNPHDDAHDSFSPWFGIWKLLNHPRVNATEPDKQLLSNLRELRTLFTNDVCEVSVAQIRKALPSIPKGDYASKKLEGRIKNVLKSLTGIGGHLSQSKEYRDIFDDILHVIGEPLHEAGLDKLEANSFLISCNSMVAGIKDILFRKLDRLDNKAKYRKINAMEMDWLRFVLCCRVCLWNMFEVLYL